MRAAMDPLELGRRVVAGIRESAGLNALIVFLKVAVVLFVGGGEQRWFCCG